MAARKKPETPRKRSDPLGGFYIPEDIRYCLYTTKEVVAILKSHNEKMFNLIHGVISTAAINEMKITLDRMKFLIEQIKDSHRGS